jgi:hypothetical protein
LTLDDIEAVLDGVAPNSREEMFRIVRDTGLCAVGLFAISPSRKNEELRLAGSGTLVSIGGLHYILTASHVWEQVLKSAPEIGITLKTKVDHSFPMDTQTIIPFGPPREHEWSELGPDLVLLYIPEAYVGAIEAAGRSFYNLSISEPALPGMDLLVAWVVIGAPGCRGKFSSRHASIEMRGSEFSIQDRHRSGGFDYVDGLVNVSDLPDPKSLGGVSGGGLWKVHLFQSLSTGKIDSIAILGGVAFWEFPVQNNHRIVRCHGLESIMSLARKVESIAPAPSSV